MTCDIARGTAPNWLNLLERRLGWIAVPHLAILFVTLQAMGFLFVAMDPAWLARLMLIPEAVRAGEAWRVVTFLALPLSMSPLWLIFALWFSYFTFNLIESEWGAFRTTLYVLVYLVVTILFSFGFDYPVTSVQSFATSMFLAAAALYPDLELRLYLAIPVKMKVLGWLSLALVGLQFVQVGWLGRFYLLAVYSNYLLFFGPAAFSSFRAWQRRRSFRAGTR